MLAYSLGPFSTKAFAFLIREPLETSVGYFLNGCTGTDTQAFKMSSTGYMNK